MFQRGTLGHPARTASERSVAWSVDKLAERIKPGSIGSGRMLAGTDIVMIELCSLNELEAVPDIEKIRSALTQRADANRKSLRIGLLEDQCKNGASDAVTLSRWPNVEMIEQQCLVLWFDYQEPNAISIEVNVAGAG